MADFQPPKVLQLAHKNPDYLAVLGQTFKNELQDFPGSPVVKTPHLLPLQRARVQSLVRELRSRMPRGTAKKNKTKKQSWVIA